MQFKNIFLFSIILIIKSYLVFGDTLLLKCTSLKFGEDDWIGNILYVKIDEEKNRVYLKEPADTSVEGWTNLNIKLFSCGS